MAYTIVYDPNGLLFEVAQHERAATLVLNHGWSWKPKAQEPSVQVPPSPQPIQAPASVPATPL